jgi:hypothetical protein
MDIQKNIAHILIDKIGGKPTPEVIRDCAQRAITSVGNGSIDLEELIAQLEADYQVFRHEATSLTNKDIKPWLKDRKSSITWALWERYVAYLSGKNSSFNTRDLDDITDKILDKCADPKMPGPWDRRGMVVGNVQSGKTANYTGLINKATDAGYKMIIVIAGVHNTLRKQTQERIDEGFIGRNSSDLIRRVKAQSIGVGRYASDIAVYSYTSSDEGGDFNRGIATKLNVPISGASPTVLVIKKNKSILENLISWLSQFGQRDAQGDLKIFDVPVLVIDDEADNASVNSGSEDDVRTINRLIRVLINLFHKSSFIGYTATPYANLFIPSSWNEELTTTIHEAQFKVGEDLFPRDFIINIHPPSNYIGATEVFGHGEAGSEELPDPLPIIRETIDQEPQFPKRINRENVDARPDSVPQSLERAIQSFILTCAIRRRRGQENKHNSMLVHVALRVAWIDRIARLVNEVVHDYRNQIQLNAGPVLKDLERLFHEDFAPTTTKVRENLKYKDPLIKELTWEAVRVELLAAITKIEVRAVHGQKNTRNLEYKNTQELNYEDYEDTGLNVIAVGGNKLARGLTLEGLSVSYYLRTTRMYDSLMQMGRWFGYRPGYVDLCRLYTTPELQLWYEHVAMATDEMRSDFDIMAAQNKSPRQFQLKVMKHPGMLMITSTARMKDHEILQLSFSGDLRQTYAFSDEDDVVEANNKLFEQLLRGLAAPSESSNTTLLWRNVEAKHVVEFLMGYNGLEFFPSETMQRYILKQNSKGLLTTWNIGIMLNSRKEHQPQFKFRNVQAHQFKWSSGAVEGGLAARSLVPKGENTLKVNGDKNAILDKRGRTIDLELSKPVNEATEPEIKAMRKELGMPLLVLLPLDPRITDQCHKVPFIGVGVQFPEFEGEVPFEYAVRPMEDLEEEVQTSDDPADND